MNEEQELLEKLQKLLVWKKSAAFYAAKLGISEEHVKSLIKELKNEEQEELQESTKEVNIEKGTLKSTIELDYDPKDDSELAKLHKVDLVKYKISSYWSKLKSNGKFTSSICATLRKPDDYTAEDFAKFLKDYTPKPVQFELCEGTCSKHKNKLVDVEISLADFHLDRRVLEGDTFEERINEYKNTVEKLINQVTGSYRVRELVFVIGNDYFNTDNYQGQTTNLTPQENTVPWHKAYEGGFDLLVDTISKLAVKAEHVTVVLVQGNHDRTKSFYLAHALEVFFKGFTNISFLRENSNTKFVKLGCTFIGYHHGNHIKIDGLPLYFATEEKSAVHFGTSKYREVHTGDKHFYMAKDVQGVRIQQIPSMVKPDNFTNDGLYIHVKSGLALCYDPVYGKCAEFEARL